MLVIDCPYCGPRDQSEFSNGGEAHVKRPDGSQNISDREWGEYVFIRSNPKGLFYERWVHSHGCRKWFNCVRDTSTDEILETFFSKEYFCYMTGFIAGMPFFGDLEKDLQAKRLETPRVKVPKGSIGLTEQFCNIYTFESPGGWNIIGNTPLKVFDTSNEDAPNLINPGDIVRFKEINIEEYRNFNE